MSDLQHYFDSMNSTANSIKTLYFRPPGIFTNSLITKPDITTILRDADNYENTLYHVDTQGKAERTDGTRGVVDHLNDEFDHLEIQQQLSEANDGNANNQSDFNRTSVVVVPKEIDTSNDKQDVNKGVKNLLQKFNETTQTDYEVDVLCETVRQLLEKYPNEQMSREIQQFMFKWETLNTEIMKHEDTLEKQRRHLSMLNVSVNDRDIGSITQHENRKKRSATDIIAEEEKEIAKLEQELALGQT